MPDPIEVWVSGMPAEIPPIRVPLHLEHPDRGYRDIKVTVKNGVAKIFIPEKDAEKLKKCDVIRLKNFCNIRIEEAHPMKATYMEGKDTKVPIMQWLPEDILGCEIIGQNMKAAGFCETACKDLKEGDIIQFERFGFCKVGEVDKKDLICYYTHD